ncbi:MAG: hypothetical protein SGPRY_006288 [Prymnesium sp.]
MLCDDESHQQLGSIRDAHLRSAVAYVHVEKFGLRVRACAGRRIPGVSVLSYFFWKQCKKEENFFISTEDALPSREPEDEDDERMVIASVWIETLLRNAAVPSPAELQSVPFLTRTPAAEWMAAALSELVDNAKLLDTGDDENQNVRAFASMDELQDHCDATLLQHLPHPLLTMDDNQNWLDTEDVPAGDAVAWLDSVTLA